MSTVPANEHVKKCAERLFREEDLPEVYRIMGDMRDGTGERLQCAVLKISKGEIGRLIHAVKESNIDYRDVLMAADFGHDVNAHKSWHGEI